MYPVSLYASIYITLHDYKRSISLQNCTFRLQIDSTWMKSRSFNMQLYIEYLSHEKKKKKCK